MRRVCVRGHENVRKRVLIQAAACNIGLLLRRQTGIGTPRSLQEGCDPLGFNVGLHGPAAAPRRRPPASWVVVVRRRSVRTIGASVPPPPTTVAVRQRARRPASAAA